MSDQFESFFSKSFPVYRYQSIRPLPYPYRIYAELGDRVFKATNEAITDEHKITLNRIKVTSALTK